MVKHKNYRLISSLAICGILGTAFALSQRADSQEKPLSERVTNLETQISDLKARVMRLEKQIFNSAASSGQSIQRVTTGKAAWRSLQKGMSKDQVRRILGDPKEINVFSTWETWWYPGIGSVEFNDSGRVKGWIEPID
jgi:hypothetical protein